jgi:hypothetical protein
MAYGLIGTGRSLSGSAQAGLGQAAKLETSRNMMGDQLAQAASGQRKALMGTGGYWCSVWIDSSSSGTDSSSGRCNWCSNRRNNSWWSGSNRGSSWAMGCANRCRYWFVTWRIILRGSTHGYIWTRLSKRFFWRLQNDGRLL